MVKLNSNMVDQSHPSYTKVSETNSRMVNEIQPILTKVKHGSLNSSMVDYGNTKIKNGLPKSTMVRYDF